MLSFLSRWLDRRPQAFPNANSLVCGTTLIVRDRSAPLRKRPAYNGPAERYLAEKHRRGRLGVTIRCLMCGPMTALQVRDQLKAYGHRPIDAGRPIRDARAALRRSGITLRSAWMTVNGKRLKSYWLTSDDVETLRLLHERVNNGK